MRGGGEGDADLAADARKAEELSIALGGRDAACTGEVHEDVRPEAADLDGHPKDFADGSRSSGIADISVDEPGVLKHGGGRRGLGGDRKVGKEAAFGVRKGAGNEMEGGQSDEGVAEAAKPVDQDTPDIVSHELQCSRDILVTADVGSGTYRELAGRSDAAVARTYRDAGRRE